MLGLASLAVGFALLQYPRSAAVTPRLSAIVADATNAESIIPVESQHWSSSTASRDLGRLITVKPNPKQPKETEPCSAPADPVISWYDTGYRLSQSAEYSSSFGLGSGMPPPLAPPLPQPPQAEPPNVETSASTAEEVAIEELIVKERIGEGSQSEVLLGELPGVGPVAVKVGLRPRAIAREAAVLGSMSGTPGLPSMIYHVPAVHGALGGVLVVNLFGSSLEDLWNAAQEGHRTSRLAEARAWQVRRPGCQRAAVASRCEWRSSSTARAQQRRQRVQCQRHRARKDSLAHFSGKMLLRVGRGILRILRELHLAGFIHNDVKPANILLGPGAGVGKPRKRTSLHLIDFGSCTLVEGHQLAGFEEALRPLGTAMFASVAADGIPPPPLPPTRPADDIESLVYTLACLSAGKLPWSHRAGSSATSMKREMMERGATIAELTDHLECVTTRAALEALWTEVRSSQSDGSSINYEACLAALGGESFEVEADGFYEFTFRSKTDRMRSRNEAAQPATVATSGLVVPTDVPSVPSTSSLSTPSSAVPAPREVTAPKVIRDAPRKKRPRGRPPKGKKWNELTGRYEMVAKKDVAKKFKTKAT
mmetsp:Transcript_18439/g.47270  ORF Transcript_18439/g.47270 Transcript_18439/m.47270 type:complete len:595 (-) Transcript_18439:172-1956(-)